MDFVIWPLMFLCLNGCYGPTQNLRGHVERLPEGAELAAGTRSEGFADEDLVRLAGEIADPLAWAERLRASRPAQGFDLRPSRLLGLRDRGVPVSHLDALHAIEKRASEADCAERVADRERHLGRQRDDERRAEQARCMTPAVPYGGIWPTTPWAVQPYFWPGWR